MTDYGKHASLLRLGVNWCSKCLVPAPGCKNVDIFVHHFCEYHRATRLLGLLWRGWLRKWRHNIQHNDTQDNGLIATLNINDI